MADPKPPRMRTLMRDARDIVWRARYRLLLGLPLMLVNRLAGLLLPATTKWLIDDVIIKHQHDLLWKIVLAAAAASIISALTDYSLAQILGIAAQRSITELRVKLQEHVQRLPINYFDTTKTGVLVSRVMNDAEGIRNLVGTGLVQLLGGVVTAGIAIGILFYFSARLAAIILVVVVVFMTILFFAFKTVRPIFKKRAELNALITGRLNENFSGIRVVKAYRAERRETRVFAHNAHDLFRNVMATMRTISGVGALTSALAGIVGVAVLVVGGNEVIAGRMTIGTLVSFTLYLGLVVMPIVQIVAIGTQLSEAFAGLERMREVLGEITEDADDKTKPKTEEIRGDVEFRDVSFEYTEKTPVLHDINLLACAGDSVALVGPSGSGKSTLVSLVAAFHRPTRGKILIDGQDLNEMRLGDYRSHIAIVPQDSFLFADTIYNNIVLGNPHATRDEVMRASKIAHVDEFTEAFADKYDTIVGERGVRLSGGQKQRVAIARAIVADPRILILDEATSSLDSESEAMIQDGLNSLMKNRTTFVIAHRLSTIRRADQILVLEEGRITERGTHAELMAHGGKYRALYEKQYGVQVNLFVNPGEELADLAKA
ncbi:MAG TPA: ABC transporter ATP-binding protein [Thermoanaerobaculia bacterium]|nr:ABC transporter ATP-binding protein [Thermoanaerobaculia bacterium]